jgi:ABC-type transporter Mla subunit MlaD
MSPEAEKRNQLLTVVSQLKAQRDRLDETIHQLEATLNEPRRLPHRDTRQLDLFIPEGRDEA